VDVVTAGDVDELATSIFPMCMQAMHDGLKARHKLKHLGRLQYGLFLKGIGLPLEEALVFWQREFTKGCSADEFLKKYAYNIRYNYGKEGKRTDFAPYSCVKVIMSPPTASDENHGE
jgi:DNA primase large subunit